MREPEEAHRRDSTEVSGTKRRWRTTIQDSGKVKRWKINKRLSIPGTSIASHVAEVWRAASRRLVDVWRPDMLFYVHLVVGGTQSHPPTPQLGPPLHDGHPPPTPPEGQRVSPLLGRLLRQERQLPPLRVCINTEADQRVGVQVWTFGQEKDSINILV